MRLNLSLLFVAAALFTPARSWARSAPHDAEYIFGTVKSIPTHAVGTLDLSDANDLRFHYGKMEYRLPYRQIKSVRFSEPKPAVRTVAHIPLPKLPMAANERILDLSFRDSKGDIGTMSLRLSGKHLSSAEWVLSERMLPADQKVAEANRSKLPESWWGDKYWKTNRNKLAWPDPNAEVVGTK